MAAPQALQLSPQQKEELKSCLNLATQFVQHFYQIFDNNRNLLTPLYHEHAILSFEGDTYIGPISIVEKLKSLSFQQIQHIVTTIDSHPLPDAGVLVMVVGQLKADADAVFGFNQTFILRQFGDSYQISNDAFRLVLHHG